VPNGFTLLRMFIVPPSTALLPLSISSAKGKNKLSNMSLVMFS